jgi:hypothetical protein
MSKETKKRGNRRTKDKIYEVCGFCTNYSIEVSSTYVVARTNEDYGVAHP